MRRRILLGVFIILLGYSLVRLGVFVFAEQHGSTPESSSTSHLKTLYDSLVSSSFGSESAGAWGDWGTMWNRIYSAITWTPSGDASPSDVASGKTFYASSRILQTGQGSLQPTPAPVTPAVGDASRLNTIYKAVKTISYGAETSGAWGDWGSMWNRIYSAASWTASSANAAVTDVLSGKTFYSGATRNQLTGTSLASGAVCVNNSDCFTGTCTTFYQDSDADTYGNASVSTKRCGATYTGYVTNSTDCNDTTNTIRTTNITGGTITTSGGYKIHTFTTAGTLTVSCPSSISTDALVVAGGGGGGSRWTGGGGGAGGAISDTINISIGSYAITIGSGGAGAGSAAAGHGASGTNSTFGSYTAIGGGGGGLADSVAAGQCAGYDGGSGGGAGGNSGGYNNGGSPTSGQGFAGGAKTTNVAISGQSQTQGAGGGGAGAAGGSSRTDVGGAGGIGINWKSLGTYYAGGGGGTRLPGGTGGGGAGGNTTTVNGVNGSTNTGGGGGGGGGGTQTYIGAGGSGGSGIVITRYLDP